MPRSSSLYGRSGPTRVTNRTATTSSPTSIGSAIATWGVAPPGRSSRKLGRPGGDLLEPVDPDPFDDGATDHPAPAVDLEPDRARREADACLEPEDAVAAAREEGDDVGAEQLGHGVDDRGDDPRPVEVGDERAADVEHALDGVQPVAPLVVEPGRPQRGRQRWTTISASATWGGPIGRSSVPSKLTTPSSSPLWTTGAATSLRTSSRAAR